MAFPFFHYKIFQFHIFPIFLSFPLYTFIFLHQLILSISLHINTFVLEIFFNPSGFFFRIFSSDIRYALFTICCGISSFFLTIFVCFLLFCHNLMDANNLIHDFPFQNCRFCKKSSSSIYVSLSKLKSDKGYNFSPFLYTFSWFCSVIFMNLGLLFHYRYLFFAEYFTFLGCH